MSLIENALIMKNQMVIGLIPAISEYGNLALKREQNSYCYPSDL
jgi:hypothetical protein